MKCEECQYHINPDYTRCKECEMAKEIHEQQFDDAISRQEVQDLLATWLSDYLTDETREVLETIDGKVGDMPPATPKQRTGHWIWGVDKKGMHYCKCSECGIGMGHTEYDYCPNCGAKMRAQA